LLLFISLSTQYGNFWIHPRISNSLHISSLLILSVFAHPLTYLKIFIISERIFVVSFFFTAHVSLPSNNAGTSVAF